jgi:hypothetical protein
MAPTPLRHQITSFVSSERFSDTFGGCVVQEDGTATVYVTEEGGAAMRAALDEAFGPSAVGVYRLRIAGHSEADLRALTMSIAHDDAWQRQEGIRLAQWGPDLPSSTVRIAVQGYTTAIAERLRERYGRDWVIVVAHAGPLPRRAGVSEPSTWPRGGPADLRALLD